MDPLIPCRASTVMRWSGSSGVDTQRLLPFGTPDEVRAEVRRLKLFGPRFVVSPSHGRSFPTSPLTISLAIAETARMTEDARKGA